MRPCCQWQQTRPLEFSKGETTAEQGTRWGQKDLQYGISSGLTRVLERKEEEEEENRRGVRRKGARRKERKEEEKIERSDKVALRV